MIRPNLTFDDLTFDVASHTYHVDGVWIPSPSVVIKQLGLGADFSHVNPDLLAYAIKRGVYVHKCVELINQNKLDPTSVDPEIAPYVDQYRQFLKDSGFIPIWNEKGEYSNLHRYAMRIDLFGKLNNRNSILDIKTSSTLDDAVEVQLSAYHMGFQENHVDQDLQDAFCLQLKKTSYSLKKIPISYSLWTSALEVFNWKVKKGKIKCPIKI